MKKLGMIAAGAMVTLLAAAPFALAGESDHGSDNGGSESAATCAFEGGDAQANGVIDGDKLGAIEGIAQGVVGGNPAGNVGNCSDFLNDNVQDNVNESFDDNFNNNSVNF